NLPGSAAGFSYRVGTFSPDGKRFAAGFEHPAAGGKALVWDVDRGGLLAEFVNKHNGISYLSFSPDGALLSGAGKKASAVWVWSVDSMDDRATLRDLAFANVHAIALSPDGTMLAVADEPFPGQDPSRGVVVFDVAKQQKVATLPGLRQPV